jgi:hypothetical protein
MRKMIAGMKVMYAMAAAAVGARPGAEESGGGVE